MISYRINFDDGTSVEGWEMVTLPDGRTKEASIDDFDLATVSSISTFETDTGQVYHSISVPKTERATKRMLWRRNVMIRMTPGENPVYVFRALAGYHQLLPDGTEQTRVDLIDWDGSVTPGSSEEITLRPHEVFDPELKAQMLADKEAADKAREEDTALITTAEQARVEEEAALAATESQPVGLVSDIPTPEPERIL